MTDTAHLAEKHLVYAHAEQDGTYLLYSDHQCKTVQRSLKDLINELCLKHGSSLDGRVASFRYIIGNVYKSCILTDERNGTMYIPSQSLDKEGSEIILYNDIAIMKKRNDGDTDIHVKSGDIIRFHSSLRTMQTQMYRCEKYLAEIDAR